MFNALMYPARPSRRRKLLRRPLLVLAWAAALALVLPSRLLAAPAEPECGLHFGELTLSEGQTLHCDLNVVGGSVLVEAGASIDGSLNVMMGSARILGEVSEDVVAARDVAVDGRVGGNVFSIGGDVDVGGQVGGKVTTARGDARLGSGAQVSGPVSARGAVALAAGARADGDVLAGEQIDVDPAASIGGRSFEHDGASGYSSVRGETTPEAGWLRAVLLAAFVILAMLFAALTQLALPVQAGRIADAASRSPGLMLLLGAIALLVTPFSWILVLPLPLSALALALGWVGLGLAWGRSVAPRRGAAAQAAVGALLQAALLMLLMGAMLALPQITMVCGLSFLLLLPIAWAYGAALFTLLGTRADPGRAPTLAADPDKAAPPVVGVQPEGEAPEGRAPADDPVPAPPTSLPIGAPAELPVAPGAPGESAPLPLSPSLPGAIELGAAPANDGSPVPAPSTGQVLAGGSGAAAGAGAAPAAPDGAPPEPALSDPVSEPPLVDEALHGPPLRQVIGLSPIYAELLRGAGILGAKDLAALSPEEVARLTQAPGVLAVGADKAAAWIRAARGLLAGGY